MRYQHGDQEAAGGFLPGRGGDPGSLTSCTRQFTLQAGHREILEKTDEEGTLVG